MFDFSGLETVIGQLGLAGALLYLLIVWIRRYDGLSEKLGDRIDKINDKRVAEARESAEIANKSLDLGVRFVDALSNMTAQVNQSAEQMERAAERMERAADRMERAAERMERVAELQKRLDDDSPGDVA